MRAAAIILAIAGCRSVPTSELSATIQISPEEPYLFVFATFFEGDRTIDLDGDRVVATFRGKDTELDRIGDGASGVRIRLEAPVVEGEPVSVAVLRDGEDDAPASTVAIAAPPRVADLPVFVSRAADFTFTFTGDASSWRIEGACAIGHGALAPGTSSVTVPAGSLGDAFEGTCTSRLTLDALHEGTLDPAFGGGTIVMTWSPVVEFASTP